MLLKDIKKTFLSNSKALEVACLLHGLKPVVRQGFYENEIFKVKEFCTKHNLAFETAPYKIVLADSGLKYSNKGFKVRVEDPRKGMFFVYISKEGNKAVQAKIFEMKNDHQRLGKILGYPSCCTEMFVKNEPIRSRLDNDYTACSLDNSKGNNFSFYTNIFKRSEDIVLLSHFPCSFDCAASIEIGKKYFRLLAEIDPEMAKEFSLKLKEDLIFKDKNIQFK